MFIIASSHPEGVTSPRRSSGPIFQSRHNQVVVIIDDHPINLTIYSKLVECAQFGVVVQTFRDPIASLGWLSVNDADVILTDYNMPRMTGAVFTQELRNSARNSEVPVVVITGRDDRAALLASLEAGATDFLKAPVDHSEFIARIRNLLRMSFQHQLLRERFSSDSGELSTPRHPMDRLVDQGSLLEVGAGFRERRSISTAKKFEPHVCLLSGDLLGLRVQDAESSVEQDSVIHAVQAIDADGNPRALAEACVAAANWQLQDYDIRLVMGLRFRDLHRPFLVKQLCRAVSPDRGRPIPMQFEVGLSANDNVDNLCIRHLDELRAHGFWLSLDGVGGLLLSQLVPGRFQELKIGSSLWRGLGDDRGQTGSLKAIARRASKVGVSLTAVGVTTLSDMRHVRDQGFRSAQGRFFSPSLAAAEVLKFVAEWQSSQLRNGLIAESVPLALDKQ